MNMLAWSLAPSCYVLAGGRAVAHRSCSLSLGTAAGGEEKNSDTDI